MIYTDNSQTLQDALKRIDELETESARIKEHLHELTFFQHRIDGHLHPRYEDGWNDAVTALTKKARAYFTAQGIEADTFVDENHEVRRNGTEGK